MAPGAEPAESSGFHVEAVKRIDETQLFIPSQLPSTGNDGVGSQALALPSDGAGKAFMVRHGDSGLSGQEIAECARLLGIDIIFDTDLLYIAEELLTSPLPGVFIRPLQWM
jgi:hypothetical protein